MDGMNIKVDVNESLIRQKINNSVDATQKVLDSQVLKDSNYYCPMDTSSLQKSAIQHTVIGSGKVVWQTPYARKQYYDYPNKSHQKNPNATMKWFESAKAKNLNNWLRIANGEFTKNYN